MDVVSAAGSFDELTSFTRSRGLVSLPASINDALPALNTGLTMISIFRADNVIAVKSGY